MLRFILLGLLPLMLLTACGPSPEALRRQQMLEAQRAEAARLEAERKAREREQRISQRLGEAQTIWGNQKALFALSVIVFLGLNRNGKIINRAEIKIRIGE